MSAGDIVAITTPDKTKGSATKPVAVDIMDARWAKTPAGYDKAPGPSAAAPDGKAPVQKQPATATPATARDTSPQPQYATSDTPTPPARPEPDAPTQAQPAAIPDAHPAQKPIAVSLASLFLPATDVTAWRAAHGMTEHYDYTTAERARLKENAMTAGIIDNGFTAEHISATRVSPGDRLTGAGGETPGEREEREEKKRNRAQLDVYQLISDFRSVLLADQKLILQEISACQGRITELEAKIAITDIQIETTQTQVTTLERDNHGTFLEKEKILREKIESAAAALETANADYEESKIGADPAQEAELKDAAWQENHGAIRSAYEEAGLGKEFDLLERHRNGEDVDNEQLKQAKEKLAQNGMTSDLDAALVKHLRDSDPDNAYLRTSDAKRIVRDEAQGKLNSEQGDYVEAIQNRLLPAFDRTRQKIEEKENFIEKLRAEKGEDSIELQKELKELEKLREREDRHNQFREKLDELEKKANAGDPAARGEIRELQQNYDKYRERHANRDTIESRIEKNNTEPTYSTQTYTPDETRTGTSAAGLVSGSSLEKAQGSLTTSFTAAAVTSPTPAPDADVDPAMTVAAAEQQRRAAPVVGMNV